MRKKYLISIVFVSVTLLSSPALAGVDPEPFTPYINQLDAHKSVYVCTSTNFFFLTQSYRLYM